MDGASMGHGDSMSALRISAVTVTPVAFADPPLLNSVGVHEPFPLPALVEVSTDEGLADLLGGAVRDEVPFSAYLFYKWAAHPGAEPDDWGEALDPDGIVAQARRMVGEYGFTALKLKGGVFPPEQEAEAIRALRAAFGGHPLRLDPNAAWTPDTSVTVARDLDGVLEYLEDPASSPAGRLPACAGERSRGEIPGPFGTMGGRTDEPGHRGRGRSRPRAGGDRGRSAGGGRCGPCGRGGPWRRVTSARLRRARSRRR